MRSVPAGYHISFGSAHKHEDWNMTRPTMQAKPARPKGYPLVPHSSGQWCKFIGGKRHYFGPWRDPDAALERYKAEFPYLQLGLTPFATSISLANVLNAFDDKKSALRDAGRISERTYMEYMAVADVIATLGKNRPIETITPLDLKSISHKLAVGKYGQPVSPVTHKRLLTFARMVFRFANEILDCYVKYREALKSPEKRLFRERRTTTGEKMFSAAEIRALLAEADPSLKVIIYLGINCGFGPNDCITLPANKIVGGFHSYARPKTGVSRRCPLWDETQNAIDRIVGDTLVLHGRVWNRHVIAREFRKLCKACGGGAEGIYRKGITSPYSLRRTFETVAKNADVNQSVIDRIMGHERPDMSEVYNQRTFDKQLNRCTDFVHSWLLGEITL